jgi:GxxExxY protein
MLNNKVDNKLTEKIIGCYYKVYNKLGYGFLEKVYENALKIELESAGLKVQTQMPIIVYYNNRVVGEYFADIVVEDQVIIELKTSRSQTKEHEAQLYNYLKATKKEIGLLFYFSAEPKVYRRIHTISNNY